MPNETLRIEDKTNRAARVEIVFVVHPYHPLLETKRSRLEIGLCCVLAKEKRAISPLAIQQNPLSRATYKLRTFLLLFLSKNLQQVGSNEPVCCRARERAWGAWKNCCRNSK
jgi:hypothetical protein